MVAKHNIKSNALPPRKIFSYLEYTASLVNAAGFILDKAVDPSESESRSTTDI
jgi:hypothetical protein